MVGQDDVGRDLANPGQGPHRIGDATEIRGVDGADLDQKVGIARERLNAPDLRNFLQGRDRAGAASARPVSDHQAGAQTGPGVGAAAQYGVPRDRAAALKSPETLLSGAARQADFAGQGHDAGARVPLQSQDEGFILVIERLHIPSMPTHRRLKTTKSRSFPALANPRVALRGNGGDAMPTHLNPQDLSAVKIGPGRQRRRQPRSETGQ